MQAPATVSGSDVGRPRTGSMSPHPRLEALRNDPDDHHVPARRTALLEDRLGHAGADVELVHLTSRARAVSDGSATESTPSLLDLPARAFASDEHVHPRRHSTSSRVLVRIGSVRNIANVPGLAQMSYKDLQFNAKIQERGLDFASYFHLNSIPEWRRKLVPASLCVAAVVRDRTDTRAPQQGAKRAVRAR